jgi:hypothetical protein
MSHSFEGIITWPDFDEFDSFGIRSALKVVQTQYETNHGILATEDHLARNRFLA